MGNGFQFIDIILFAMIAAFLIFRLRRVLGRRDGHEGGYRDPFKPADDETAVEADEQPDDNVVQLPDRSDEEEAAAAAAAEPEPTGDDPLSQGLARIREADGAFDRDGFIAGARAAFEMILGAYASGDTATLENLLSPEVYGNFAQAIRDREAAGEVLEDTLVGIDEAQIVEAGVENHHAFITVKFVSEQVNVTRDEDGAVVDGDPNAVITVTDFWTFSRDTRSDDPNWTLVATRSLD